VVLANASLDVALHDISNYPIFFFNEKETIHNILIPLAVNNYSNDQIKQF